MAVLLDLARLRAGGRVVECAGLEIQYTCKRIVSSNLTLPATFLKKRLCKDAFFMVIPLEI